VLLDAVGVDTNLAYFLLHDILLKCELHHERTQRVEQCQQRRMADGTAHHLINKAMRGECMELTFSDSVISSMTTDRRTVLAIRWPVR
jgi:hypothetical protein